jgi:hypothetical protein
MLGIARTIFLGIAVLGVVTMIAIQQMRRRALSADEIARWKQGHPAPLSAADLERLQRWQRNMRIVAVGTLFYVGVMVGFASALPEEAMVLRWIAFLILPAMIVAGVVLQFSVRCPRCSMHIGLQTSLGVPQTCERCGVPFRK